MNNIISIHGYDIHYRNGEPTIKDLDLAKRLEYVEPRAIRKLIKRMLDSGQLKPEQVWDTVSQTSEQGGRPGTTYYLGEFASLKVTTQAGTAKADEITNEIIQVFIDARHQGAHHPEPDSVLVSTRVKLEISKAAAEMLRMSDTSKLRMLAKVANSEGVDSSFLPSYVDESLARALTQLLKDHGSALSAKAANLALLDMGMLKELERKGSKGDIKRFKSLTSTGLKYGRNETSPQNPRETQPLYFDDRFPELLGLIEAHLAEDKAA